MSLNQILEIAHLAYDEHLFFMLGRHRCYPAASTLEFIPSLFVYL